MSPSKSEISREIRQIDNLGEALEYLATCAGCGNSSLLADELSSQGFGGSDGPIKPETISNWFRGRSKPQQHLDNLLEFFEKRKLLANKKSDPTVYHLRLLMTANERQIERIVDGGIKVLVDQLLKKDRAWLAGYNERGIDWVRTRQAREIDASRALLIKKLMDQIDRLDEIDPYASDLARLLRMPHWNDARALELRVDFRETSELAISKISDPTSHSSLLLMSRFADLLYLDNQTEKSDRLYSEIGDITPDLAESDAERILREKVDYLMLGTKLTPDDVSFLFKTGNRRNDIYNRASAERCKGCRAMRAGHYDQGRALLEKSRGTLSQTSYWDARSKMVRVYIDTLELLADWNEGKIDPATLSLRSDELIAQIKANDPDEKPLLAGLLSIQLQVRLQEEGFTQAQGANDHKSLVLALQIDELLNASIQNYCFFDLPELHRSAKEIVRIAKSLSSL